MECQHPSQVHLGKIITIQDKEGRTTLNPVPVCEDGAPTAQEFRFIKGDYPHLVPPLLEKFLHLSGAPMGIDQDFIDTMASQVFQPNLQQGFIPDGQEAFRQFIGEGPQAGSQTGR